MPDGAEAGGGADAGGGGTETGGGADAGGEPDGPGGGHYIVCGGNSLAYRLILELTEQYEVPVVAVVPDRSREHGPAIARIPGVRAVLEHSTVTGEALGAAGVEHARGIALMDGTDQENIHAALAAENRNPGVRIVLRIFNQRLGEHLEKLLPNCAALSGSATAAPAFANGALSRPHTVEVGGRQLYVAHDGDIRPDQICLVADRIDRQDLSRLRLLPGRAAAPPTSSGSPSSSAAARRSSRAAARCRDPRPNPAAWPRCRPSTSNRRCASRGASGSSGGCWTGSSTSPTPGCG
ncbi:NAD(P)-binding protein [Kitasatospora saccharophila]|uniref:NAD(P)-binding protein n=1 Tax=Kitasatospora saccharophila TaxID=407973 RepID=UPI00363A5B8E